MRAKSDVGVLSVTEFVRVIEEGLAAFAGTTVRGEVAEFKIIHNKWVTFRLQDETSSIGCFMTVWKYTTEIADGILVEAVGTPRLREKGWFSFVVERVTPVGEGALKRAFELLQKKLTAEGLFDASRKRPLPRFPEQIGLITSRDAAAYSDFLKVLQGRAGGLHISFIHSQVQGVKAVNQLLAALARANTLQPELDVIVMVRGGGSLEDLAAFNDEAVVRAVAASRVPIIVGIGHERDVCLSELAADVRASTPSNAAEKLVRSRAELAGELTAMRSRLQQRMQDALTDARALLGRILDILRGQVRTMDRDLKQLTRVLQSLSPENVLQRGYSITRASNGKILTATKAVTVNDLVITQLRTGSFTATVTEKRDV